MAEDAFVALLALDAAARAHAAQDVTLAPAAGETGARALNVRVAGRLLCVALAHVREVKRCPPLAAVPGTHRWLAGATAWHGRAVAVVDLARLAFDSDAQSGESLLLCAADDKLVGLQVDTVLETSVGEWHVTNAGTGWLSDADDDARQFLDVPALLADARLRQAGRWPRVRRAAPRVAMQEQADGG